ncbi:hypothetical protein C8J36_1065 [Rhizobium sp. PP-F2F-G48]|nr:hypothetical protein C8J36_1065 [Rhizobium sp. PP-F2F-G48]
MHGTTRRIAEGTFVSVKRRILGPVRTCGLSRTSLSLNIGGTMRDSGCAIIAQAGHNMRLKRRTLLVVGGWTMTGSAATGRNAPRSRFNGDLLADYFQIYVRDQDHPELPTNYSEDSIAARLMTNPYAAIVHTSRDMTVPVSIDWYDVRPEVEIERYQHVVEGGFSCPSGVLVVAGLTDYEPTAQRLPVMAGPLGLRVNMSGLDSISDDGLDGNDRYLLQLWPEPGVSGPRVLKAWVDR